MKIWQLFLLPMRIAINALFLQNDDSEGSPHFVNEIFSKMAIAHPEHEFMFLFDRTYHDEITFASNETPIIISPITNGLIAKIYWYYTKAPKRLLSEKVDFCIQTQAALNLNTKIPQIVIIEDQEWLGSAKLKALHQRIFNWFFTKPLFMKAQNIIAVSHFAKQTMVKHYPLLASKITVIKGAADEGYQPVTWEDKEQVKDGYVEGREYFLFSHTNQPVDHFINLLKAFSLFKKWQQSNMKLILTGKHSTTFAFIEERLKTYKYREDVLLLLNLSEEQLIRLTATAYAFIFPSDDSSFCQPILNAFQCKVPVIAGNDESIRETAADAVLYVNFSDSEEIAKGMLTLYKDEAKKNTLIKSGLEQVATYNWNQAADQFWQIISNTLQKR